MALKNRMLYIKQTAVLVNRIKNPKKILPKLWVVDALTTFPLRF